MSKAVVNVIEAVPVDERARLSLSELCRACDVHAEYVMELVAEGALEPEGGRVAKWRFSAVCLRRTRTALRLQQDLRVNVAGVALALDLLEEVESLREKLGHNDEKT